MCALSHELPRKGTLNIKLRMTMQCNETKYNKVVLSLYNILLRERVERKMREIRIKDIQTWALLDLELLLVQNNSK